MIIRDSHPAQYRITLIFTGKIGQRFVETLDYSFPTEPSELKRKITVGNLANSLIRTIPGLTLVDSKFERISR